MLDKTILVLVTLSLTLPATSSQFTTTVRHGLILDEIFYDIFGVGLECTHLLLYNIKQNRKMYKYLYNIIQL